MSDIEKPYWPVLIEPSNADRAEVLHSVEQYISSLEELADKADAYIPRLEERIAELEQRPDELERAVQWAISHGFSTGHADGWADFLDELLPQITERLEQRPAVTREELNGAGMSDQMTFDKWFAEWGPMHHACDRKEFARAAWNFQQSRIEKQALDHMAEVNQLTGQYDVVGGGDE